MDEDRRRNSSNGQPVEVLLFKLLIMYFFFFCLNLRIWFFNSASEFCVIHETVHTWWANNAIVVVLV